MIKPSNIFSLTEFQKNTKEFIKRLEESGEPIVLTVNGRAKLVVQDAEAFGGSQIDESRIDWKAAREAILEAEADVKAGRVRPFREFVAEMQQDYDV